MKALLFISLLTLSFNALADFTTSLQVTKVINSKSNQYAADVDEETRCSTFKGTYQGNSIMLYPKATGGSGSYSHRLVWQISESYQTFDLTRKQHEVTVKNGYSYRLKLPELKDDVPYVQQSVLLITTDLKTGKRTSNQLVFNVSRPVILNQTNDPEKLSQSCHQVFPAFESVSGILSNGSTNPSQLIVRHSVQRLWTRTSGAQYGYYISPLAWSVVGNVLSFNRGYFNQFSRQTIETVEIANSYDIAPGDFIQLFEQRTRYVTPFDIFEVDSCGETQKVEGTYFTQWWGRAYHAVPMNPYADDEISKEAIGVSPMNNCPDELTPEFLQDNLDFIFTGTN